MNQNAWRVFLGLGATCAALAMPFGPLAQGVALLIIAVSTCVFIFAGARRWKPDAKSPWIGLSAAVAFILLASIFGALGIGDDQSPRLSDYFVMVGYLLIIWSAERLGRLRSDEIDPTNLIDAIVFTLATATALWATFMVPYLLMPNIATGDKVNGAVFAVLDSLIFLGAARLAVGPGAKTRSYYLLAGAAFFVLASDVVIDAKVAEITFLGEDRLIALLPALGLICLGAAAMHPSMKEITKPAVTGIARASTRRLLLTNLAILIPPVLVILQYHRTNEWAFVQWLGPVCLLNAVLVMYRFSGLARARERAGEISATLAASSLDLMSATSRAEMYSVALRGTGNLALKNEDMTSVSVAMVSDDGHWYIVATSSQHAAGMDLPESRMLSMDGLFDADRESAVTIKDNLVLGPDEVGHSSLVVPLVSQNQLRGALIATSKRQLSRIVKDGVAAFAGDVSLALEAASLQEDLHRRRSDRRFRALIESSADLIVVVDREDKITFLSPPAERLLGWRKGDVRALLAAVHEQDRLAVLRLIGSAWDQSIQEHGVEFRTVDVEGEVRWYEGTAKDLRDDEEVGGVVLNAHDITERKTLENDLRHRVLHDELTGLANRTLFRDRLEHALSGRRGSEVVAAVLFIDLDDFKSINDGLGHGVGDEILKVVAFRLQAFLRAEDTPARLGADEFAVLLTGVNSREEVEEVAGRLMTALREPVAFGTRQIAPHATIGIAYADADAGAEIALRNADVAMYHAKSLGKNRIESFDESMYATAMERLELREDLGRAIERNEFSLYYQPLVDMATGDLTGFEALLRWNHSKRGFVSPVSFIPIAEETGLIVPIGKWVLEESLRQLVAWNADASAPVKMSVNVSPVQLLEPSIVNDVAEALNSSGVDPSQVTLELTETAVLDDPEIRARIVGLRGLGVGLAADDFGSGFASYAALQQLPFSIVKIDRSLIMNIPDPTGVAEAQVRSIVEMAHNTGLNVVVEGIEEPVQREILRAMGCDRAQGYLFGRPLPADEARERVIAHAPVGTAK